MKPAEERPRHPTQLVEITDHCFLKPPATDNRSRMLSKQACSVHSSAPNPLTASHLTRSKTRVLNNDRQGPPAPFLMSSHHCLPHCSHTSLLAPPQVHQAPAPAAPDGVLFARIFPWPLLLPPCLQLSPYEPMEHSPSPSPCPMCTCHHCSLCVFTWVFVPWVFPSRMRAP